MNTDDLISGLSADARHAGMPVGRSWVLALLVAAAAAAVAWFTMLGPRPDIMAAAGTMRFLFKFVVALALVGSAWVTVTELSRPDGSPKRLQALLAAPALLAIAVMAELFAMPSDQWMSRLVGTNYMLCLISIPLIGLVPLGVLLRALRHGASTHAGVAGFACGLLAGGVAATFYAAHCFDDSPLFVAVWYTAGIAILGLVGGLAGRRIARW